jgi:hypothetical protein
LDSRLKHANIVIIENGIYRKQNIYINIYNYRN